MKQSVRHYFLLILTVFSLTAGLAGAGCASMMETPPGFEGLFHEFEAFDPPRKWPDTEIFDLYGGSMMMSELKGKWRLVNFWAAWCPNCLTEIPTLQELDKKFGPDKFEVNFISLDFPRSPEFLEDILKKYGFYGLETYYIPDPQIWEKIDIVGIPTTLVIDPQGLVRYKLSGDIDWMGKESLEFIGKLMNNR